MLVRSSLRLTPRPCPRTPPRRRPAGTVASNPAPAATRLASAAVASLFPWRAVAAVAAAGALALALASFSSRGPWSRPVERAWSRSVADTLAAAPPDAEVVAKSVPGRLLARDDDAAALAAALAPSAAAGLYFIVAGPPSSGKSTLIKLALPKLAAAGTAGGSAHVNCAAAATADAAGDPGRALATAIGFSFEDVSRAFSRVAPVVGAAAAAAAAAPDPSDTIARAAAALEEGAATLRQNGKPPPLIVIDGCDALAARGGDAVAALLTLQTLAAAWAAHGLVTLAFVAGVEAERILTSAPAAASSVRVDAPRLAPAAAAAWLRARGVAGDDAALAPLVAAAGDDFAALARAARDVVAGGYTIEAAADSAAAAAEPRFALAGALDGGDRQDAALAAIAAVAARKSISPADWRRLVPNRDARAALLAEGDGGPLTRGGGRGTRGDVTFATAADAAFVARGLLTRALADETAWARAVAASGGGEKKENGDGTTLPPTAGTDA